MLSMKRSDRLGGDAGQLGVAGKHAVERSILRRRSSIVCSISVLSLTTRGVMNSTSSVRLFVQRLAAEQSAENRHAIEQRQAVVSCCPSSPGSGRP